MRWASTNLPSCGELDSLMPGIFFPYSAHLLLSSHFAVCTEAPSINNKAEDVWILSGFPQILPITQYPLQSRRHLCSFFILVKVAEGWNNFFILKLLTFIEPRQDWHRSMQPTRVHTHRCISTSLQRNTLKPKNNKRRGLQRMNLPPSST